MFTLYSYEGSGVVKGLRFSPLLIQFADSLFMEVWWVWWRWLLEVTTGLCNNLAPHSFPVSPSPSYSARCSIKGLIASVLWPGDKDTLQSLVVSLIGPDLTRVLSLSDFRLKFRLSSINPEGHVHFSVLTRSVQARRRLVFWECRALYRGMTLPGNKRTKGLFSE